jgi:hypothetical protein
VLRNHLRKLVFQSVHFRFVDRFRIVLFGF